MAQVDRRDGVRARAAAPHLARDSPAPAMPDGMPRWQQGAAHPTHFLLYLLLMLVIPVSGYLYSSGGGHSGASTSAVAAADHHRAG